ncbi:MAG: hypothetical protein ACI865_001027 [Flavobacteriaceae bacterium]|jgi:hypothetical protein
MKSFLGFCLLIGMLGSCKKDNSLLFGYPESLKSYIEANYASDLDGLIACAGGTNTSFLVDSVNPIAVFLYSAEDAYEFRYYETDSVNLDPNNYRNYSRKNYSLTNLFHGVMKKFDHPPMLKEKSAIVTYKTPGKLHVCTPIRLKAFVSPTLGISAIMSISPNGTEPTFDWSAEAEPNNVIYFSMVSSLTDTLISGTFMICQTLY